jgi:hypothetical protein
MSFMSASLRRIIVPRPCVALAGRLDKGTAMKRVRWYASRLQAMDAREVALRARRGAQARVDAALWRAAPRLWQRRWLPGADWSRCSSRASDDALGFLTPDRVAFASERAAAETPRVLARAEAALERRVSYFGYPEVALDEHADFARDPWSGRRWPDRHGKLLDYRRGDHGDPKWIWELNRCQELPLLCLAWRLTGEARFAEAARDRMLGWIGLARPGRGIAWSNGFEAALRATSFALTFDALRGSGLIDEVSRARVLQALWQHGRWILRDHSFGSSANNHLIGEAGGLAVIGLLAPELPESGAWVDRGLGWLELEASRQILPDGGGAEQAFAYHLFVCDLLMLVSALLLTGGVEPPEQISAALRRSASALGLQVQPGEPEPAYGDSDDGRAFLFDVEEVRSARAVASSLACATGSPQAAGLAGRPDFTSLLLFGPDGERRFAGAGPAIAQPDGVLPDLGLVVLRRHGTRTTFDTGPLGYLRIAAHGHADSLALSYSDGAQELVIDPGTGTYFGDRALRHSFRSTAAHATVAVDGLDQAVYGGPFLWLKHPRTRLTHLDLESGVVVGEVAARSRSRDPVRHRRAVVALSTGALLVYDRLDARLPHRYAQTWPLHPSLVVRERAPSLFEGLVGGSTRVLAAFAPHNARIHQFRGEDGMTEGWWSRRLERIESTVVLRAEQESAGRTEFLALLVPTRGADTRDPGLSVSQPGTTTVATFVLDGASRVTFDLDGAEPVVLEGVKS